MLTLTRKEYSIAAETMGGALVWDAARGGQITGFAVKNDLAAHALLADGDVLPDLHFVVDGKRARLADVRADVAIARQQSDCVVIATRATLFDGLLEVTQEYELHEEGALFCNLAIDAPPGAEFELGECGLTFALRTHDTRRARWAYFTRVPTYKRDYSTVHAFVGFSMDRAPADAAEVRDLLPYLSLDLGWEGTRFYSNRVEFLLEDRTAYNDGPIAQTCTRAGVRGGRWQAQWFFQEGGTIPIRGRHRYRNRWGIMFGRARTRRGPDADPAVRNNALGAKICHCMYPYARAGDSWPWVSMPIKQIPEQPPQLYVGNPELSRVDEAADLGADTMVIHQFWMSNPGSNNEPPADYHAFDPEWLKAFTERCHARGMRVLPYVRGTEMWLQYSSFFEDFFESGRDGLYADWNTPFCMGHVKCSPLHVSAHHHFHFTKALRRRVGDGGVLIGHTSIANLVGSACFDVALGGEVSVRHDELLANPASAAYYAALDGMGAHLISGNLPDRIAFSSARAAALCAALGMTSHPFMEPDVPFAERVAFIKPLWDAMNSLPGSVVRLHNPAYAPTRAVQTAHDHLFPSLWQSDAGKALLLVTNMSETDESGVIELDTGELDVTDRATIRPLTIEGASAACTVDGRNIRVEGLPPERFAALLIG